MTPEFITLIGIVLTGIGAFARWAVRMWATVRREGIDADKTAATWQRADNERMVNALLESARSNTALAGKVEMLTSMIHELAPLNATRQRNTAPLGVPLTRADEH